MNLRNKVALIAGGTRMGHSIALALAERGCSTVLTWRKSKAVVEGTVRELRQAGATADALRCDLNAPVSVRRAVAELRRRWKRLDVLVNLASIYAETDLLGRRVGADWDDNVAANAKGGFLLSLAAAPLMRASGGGRIIHFSDWTAASGRPRYKGFTPYYVSKAAMKASIEALALELAPEILVNGIAPGPILPPPGMSAAEKRAVEKATPLGRWGGPEAIARTVVYLAETDFVTGETIRVDGGRHLN